MGKQVKMINLRLSDNLKSRFDKYCKQNGYSVSKRLRLLIENDMSNNE